MGLRWLLFVLWSIAEGRDNSLNVHERCTLDTKMWHRDMSLDQPKQCSVLTEDRQNSLNVSERCMLDTKMWLRDMNQDKPKEYAVLMYDAFGKMGSDVEGGNVKWPGSLRECLSVQGPTFSGQYCQVLIKQDKEYLVGICVPDSCSEKDVHTLAVNDMFQVGQISLIPQLPHILSPYSSQAIIWTQCVPTSRTPDPSAIICLLICLAVVAIPLVATLLTAIIRCQNRKEVSPGVESSSLHTKPSLYGIVTTNCAPSGEDSNLQNVKQLSTMTHCRSEEHNSCVQQCLHMFSLQSTTQHVLSTAPASLEGNLSSLNGIRVLSLLWIICGHTLQTSISISVDNVNTWKKASKGNPLHVLGISGPIYLAVDTFLLLGGLLSAKSLLGSIRRAEDKLRLSLVADYLFKRIKRIQPLHLFIVCLSIGFYSVIQRGAFWVITENEVNNCKKNWWSNLLLIHNIAIPTGKCAPWTWYLSMDFQFCLTTPLLVYLYRRNKVMLLVVSALLLLMSSLASAVITARLQLPVHQQVKLSRDYYGYYYSNPFTRYGPYLIGILTGIYMTTRKDTFLKHQWQAVLGWVSCLSGMALLVGLSFVLQEVPAHPSVPHALYQGLHRSLWALGVAWIILACEDGYGGIIKSFLSWRVWFPLSNICFACYMVHPIVILFYNINQETMTHYTDINFMYQFLGHVMLTMVLGYVLTVLVEKPYLFMKGNST